MITPNIWGQGQLFAFSALDGNSLYSDDFVGILSGDKIGIRFFTKVKRELAITGIKGYVPCFETVASDIITIKTQTKEMNIIYADTHLIIGNVIPPATAVVLTDGICNYERVGQTEIQNTLDGEYTAILQRGNKFAFAFGHSCEEVVKLAEKGIETDIESLKERKLSFYAKNPLSKNDKYAELYAKCISVMKTQLYSPEGRYTKIWSTPDRLPHKNLWLWDSVFHSIGHRNLHPKISEDLILDIFAGQTENGFIPHMATIDDITDITQPPVIAWGSYLVYQKSKNKEFLKEVFAKNQKFLEWCRENRRQSDCELYTWLTANNEVCRCDECGMDNSPRFDEKTLLEAIDFSCFMANDVRFMAKIATELSDCEGEKYYLDWYNKIKTDINQKLWCEDEGFYFDYDILNKRIHKIWSVASFLPLFAGICDQRQAERLLCHLKNPETFYSAFPIPSISKEDPTYGSDMWRGPVWINYNYMIINGLKDYGFNEFAQEIREKTLDILNYWYLKTGTIFEFYDPENLTAPSKLNRKGEPYEPYDFEIRIQSIRDYGWSNTLCLDLICNNL